MLFGLTSPIEQTKRIIRDLNASKNILKGGE